MPSDWTFAEDRRPAIALLKEQPEKTARGSVWTLIGHGRVYPLVEDEDGA